MQEMMQKNAEMLDAKSEVEEAKHEGEGLGHEFNELGDFDNSRNNSFIGDENYKAERRATINPAFN